MRVIPVPLCVLPLLKVPLVCGTLVADFFGKVYFAAENRVRVVRDSLGIGNSGIQ